MKKFHILSSLITILIISASCNLEEYRIKNLIEKLEPVNKEIIYLQSQERGGAIIEQLKRSENKIVRNQISQIELQQELCKITYFPDMGISYAFKCKNDSWDSFFDNVLPSAWDRK